MTVIKHGNILQYILLSGIAGLVVTPVNSLLFEAAEKAFCHSIVETIASAAHTTYKAVYFQKLPVLPAGILRPAVRMYCTYLARTGCCCYLYHL